MKHCARNLKKWDWQKLMEDNFGYIAFAAVICFGFGLVMGYSAAASDEMVKQYADKVAEYAVEKENY